MIAWLLAGCAPSAAPPILGDAVAFVGERPRNVLMLSIDTLRRDHVGRYGGPVRTPVLDRLLADGVAFDDHTTCSNWTWHGVACSLLGRSVVEAGTLPNLHGARAPFPETEPFLAAVLAEVGFHTVLVSSNPWLGEDGGTHHGYAEFALLQAPAPTVWAEATRRLAAAPDAPWLLHVHLIDPHAPYDPGHEWLGDLSSLPPLPEGLDLSVLREHYEARARWGELTDAERTALELHLRARYQGEVARVDALIGGFLAQARGRGWLDDTLVVLWSDHGEAFFEHGEQGHACTLYAEENDGIALLWSDHLVPRAWDGPTRSEDLAPTILEALGLEVPAFMTGVPVGRADPGRVRTALSLGRLGTRSSVRVDDAQLLYDWKSGAIEVYDLAEDPAQTVDLADPADPLTRALWEALRPEVEAVEALRPEIPRVPPAL